MKAIRNTAELEAIKQIKANAKCGILRYETLKTLFLVKKLLYILKFVTA